MTHYITQLSTPSVDTYRMLRVGAGLSPKTAEAAAKGLRNTLFAVQILHAGAPVGMGRVVGDGGYVSLIADGKAHALYAQFGFAPTAPASIGMAYLRAPAAG
jgi:hypothetical protein